jgi:predicted secreted protein
VGEFRLVTGLAGETLVAPASKANKGMDSSAKPVDVSANDSRSQWQDNIAYAIVATE